MNYPQARYDRSISAPFLAEFKPGGFAASLLDYARAQYPIDLQFRKNPKNGAQHVTLYVGMTAVLNVLDKGAGGYRLEAHPKYKGIRKVGWELAWEQPHAPDWWGEHWLAVEDYLERIIPEVMGGSLTSKEGPVQAAVSVFKGDAARVMLDREVIPSFIDDPTRKRVIRGFSDSLAASVAQAGVPGTAPTKFGPKCDVLAIHHDGYLEAIEVKPQNVSSLAWVPAQATMYAKLLEYWIGVDSTWAETIRRTFQQRQELGLVSTDFSMPSRLEPRVVPAVAFQRTASGPYVDRMFKVQEHLVVDGVGDPGLRLYRASISGRLTQVDGP
ncbi:hypothetical protein ACOCJ4_05615 [Knoellia sp. CPCC 206435]|uniref:hypothetical protein n=1 Tax=Knoellia terrae TaxID=3404797 RepID=UPI003B43D48D